MNIKETGGNGAAARFVTLRARPTGHFYEENTDRGGGEDKFRLYEELKELFYAVCAHTWPSGEADGFCMCTYYMPLPFSSCDEARAYVKNELNGKHSCPWCGYSRFRVKDAEALRFERENSGNYFYID